MVEKSSRPAVQKINNQNVALIVNPKNHQFNLLACVSMGTTEQTHDATHCSSSESDADSGSESSGSTSSSEGSSMVARPVYVKRSHAGKPETFGSRLQQAKSQGLKKAECQQKITREQVVQVDDTDDIDPEKEYIEWQLRERRRLERDRAAMDEIENAKNDAVRSKLAS